MRGATEDGGWPRRARAFVELLESAKAWRPQPRAWVTKLATGPRVQLVRLAPRVHRPLTAAALASVLLGASLTPLFTLASGRLVGAIPGAVEGGLDSSSGRRLLTALAVMGGLYAVQLAVMPGLSFLTNCLGRRVDRDISERLMLAVLGPPGIGHLEDPTTQDDVAKASGIVTGSTPGNALAQLVNLWSMRLAGAGAFVILLGFRWWLACLLVATILVTRRMWRRRYDDVTAAFFDTGQIHRRSAWFRDAALLPGPAKEVRAFGLQSWLRGRQHASWDDAMAPVWVRMRGRPLRVALVAAVGPAGSVLAMAILARSALRGSIDLEAFVVYATAIGNVGNIGSAGDADHTVSTGVAP
ncbi:MAG TPA: hypothetical protein VF230_10125, partial [Acidimicrobiales bacterium]